MTAAGPIRPVPESSHATLTTAASAMPAALSIPRRPASYPRRHGSRWNFASSHARRSQPACGWAAPSGARTPCGTAGATAAIGTTRSGAKYPSGVMGVSGSPALARALRSLASGGHAWSS